MRVERMVVAIFLLAPVLAGCRSAMPVQTEQATISQTIEMGLEAQVVPVAAVPEPELSEEELKKVEFTDVEQSELRSPPALEDAGLDRSLVQPSLTLSDLEGIAFQNNPTLAAAAARITVARGRRVQAGLYPNPVVGYHATEVGNQGTSGQQGGFISQDFITAGKLQLDQEVAGKEIEAESFQFRAQEQRVLSDVRVRFYEAVVAQRRVELTEDLVSIGNNLVQATQTLLAGRLGTQNDLLQAEIRADEASILHDNARNENIEAWRRLSAVIGISTMELTPLLGELDADLPTYGWDDCYGMVLGGNPELNAARARAEQMSVAIRRAEKEPIPNVNLWVSVRRHKITESDVANIRLGVPVPIFDKNQGNIRSAEANWVAATKEVQRIELDLQDRLAVAYRRYANARQQAERYGERMIPRADRSLRLVTDGYEKGQVDYLDLLNAQQTYLQVNLSYLDSLRELRSAAAVIEGQLLTGSLARKP